MKRFALWICCSVTLLGGCAAPATVHQGLASLRQQSDRDYAQGQLQAAAAGYAQLTASVQNDPLLWARLGNTQALLGHPQRAADAYAKALRLKPDFAAVRYNFAMLRLRQAQAQLIAASATPDLPTSLMRRIQAMQEVLSKLDVPDQTPITPHPSP
jgi:cytochrome c-type biogenesis protein CcmH/NrfG